MTDAEEYANDRRFNPDFRKASDLQNADLPRDEPEPEPEDDDEE